MKLTRWFFALCALMLVQPRVLGQEQDKPIVVSPLIGDTLDAVEREKFQLFPNVKGFEWAVFYLGADGSLVVKASLLEDGVRRDTIIARYRTASTLSTIRNQIRQFAEGKTSRETHHDPQVLDRLRCLAEERTRSERPARTALPQDEKGKVVNVTRNAASESEGKDKVVILSPRVGSVIDATERKRYELFQEIKDFDRAVFLQTPDRAYYARIMLMGPDGRKETTVQYTEDELKALAEQIEHFEDLKEGKYHMGDQPANIQLAESTMIRTEETVTRRTQEAEGVDVVLLLRNGQEVEGELVSVRDSSVLIGVGDQNVPRALATGVQGILGIKDAMISGIAVEGSSHVLLGMGLGFLGAAEAGAAILSEKDPITKALDAVFFSLAGTLVGGLVGAAASESGIEVNLSVPAERSVLKKLARYPEKEPEFLQRVK